MLVKAKCIARAWDNDTAREYLPNIEYEIDSESKLADLTVTPVAYDDSGNAVRWFRNPKGEVVSQRIPKPAYVFEFDRNATKTKDGATVVMDYSCKKCGDKFDTLADLGRHSNSKHKGEDLIPDDEPVQPRVDGRSKPRTFTCKTCGEVLPNLYAMGVHNKTHAEVGNAVGV